MYTKILAENDGKSIHKSFKVFRLRIGLKFTKL